jgi:hypothetical protein
MSPEPEFGDRLEGCGPPQPAVYEHLNVIGGADGADALQGMGQCRPEPEFGDRLEGCGPSQPPVYEILIVFRGADGAGALQGLNTTT